MNISASAAVQGSKWRSFHVAMALAMAIVVFLGFSRTFYLDDAFPEAKGPPEKLFILHGLLFSAWPLLFIVQTFLVVSGRTVLHRKLGAAGALLAVLMVVLGIHAALVAAARPGGFNGIPVPAPMFLIVPVADIALFAWCAWRGIATRNDPQAHKRWLLLASMSLLSAAFARIPGIQGGNPLLFFGMTDLFLLPMLLHDRATLGYVHRVTKVGGLVIVASQPLRLAVMGTAAWQAIANWAIDFVR
jgi:hypothetical protein